MPVEKQTLSFLKKLKTNNNREWFAENKGKYIQAHENALSFTTEILTGWNKVEAIPQQDPKKCLFRIYRDVRFSKDKSPYKPWLSLYVKRSDNRSKMGIYVHIEPGNTIAGTGIYEATPPQLKAIRQELDYNAGALRKILKRKKFTDTFGQMSGNEVKTAPRGYTVDNPEIDLIRKKQFLVFKKFSDAEVTAAEFPKKVIDTFKVARPFMDYFDTVLSEVARQASK